MRGRYRSMTFWKRSDLYMVKATRWRGREGGREGKRVSFYSKSKYINH